ncbi:ABC transporter ATP-binding protein [Desulfovibrio inopinatus]|uniref:ABC transporter ATP-binding protein n=1 Tax=Desulfovibrio inopinatus TaxID=102109 RepID=UPI00041F599F|nr:ABC transporter ATP-binding protein [Desulfovibrio inopinatus]
MILDVQGVSFHYKSHPVLHDVHFHVGAGELLAILGPNGVGKTTLLKCINAIQRPSAGTVLVEGINIRGQSPADIARHVSYVAQRSDTARLTVFDAVLMGRKPHVRWNVCDADMKMVDAVIKRMGLEALALRFIDQLSGGELQKVSIARALVQEPRLLLLDEPTSALDMRNQEEILHLLRRIVDSHGIAAVMTMHDLNSALRFAHKFLFLKNGTVFAAGNADQLCQHMVEEVYGLPVEIHQLNGQSIVIPTSVFKETSHAKDIHA